MKEGILSRPAAVIFFSFDSKPSPDGKANEAMKKILEELPSGIHQNVQGHILGVRPKYQNTRDFAKFRMDIILKEFSYIEVCAGKATVAYGDLEKYGVEIVAHPCHAPRCKAVVSKLFKKISGKDIPVFISPKCSRIPFDKKAEQIQCRNIVFWSIYEVCVWTYYSVYLPLRDLFIRLGRKLNNRMNHW